MKHQLHEMLEAGSFGWRSQCGCAVRLSPGGFLFFGGSLNERIGFLWGFSRVYSKFCLVLHVLLFGRFDF